MFLCGCSNKLTCTYETNYEDIEIVNKIIFDFKEIEDYKEEYNLVLEDNIIISEIEDVIKLDGDKKKIKEQYESYDYKCR